MSDQPTGPRDSPLLTSLFPPGVRACELECETDLSALLPEERACVARSVPKRQAEFAAGRAGARWLLSKFGVERFPLVPGADRQPLWPQGLTGSITHTRGFCGVAVAESSRYLSLGVDTELATAVNADILHQICVPQEVEWLATIDPGAQPGARSLLFSAKEAFYKCQFVLTAEWVGFHDVRIELPEGLAGSGAFVVTPLAERAWTRDGLTFEARYRFHDRFVSTGVSVARGAQ